MRLAALLLAWAPGIWLAAACTPREDLEAYSSGARETREGPLEPSLADPAPAGSAEPAPPADPGSGEADVGATEPNTDGQGQPTGLAEDGSDGDGAGTPGQAPAAGAGDGAPPDEPPGNPPATVPPETMPPAVVPPAAVPPAAVPPAAVPPAMSDPAPAPPTFRFVRLVADSDVTGGPLSSIAELGVLGANGQPLPRTGWVASADSAEQTYVGGAPASMAIDGDAVTMWHTPWFEVVPPPHPHFIQIDLGQARRIAGFRYLARQDGAPDGRVADFRFYVSVDGVEWGEPVAEGTLANSDQSQDVRLAAP